MLTRYRLENGRLVQDDRGYLMYVSEHEELSASWRRESDRLREERDRARQFRR